MSLGAAVGNALFLIPFRRATALAPHEPLVLALLFFAALYNSGTALLQRGAAGRLSRLTGVELWCGLWLAALSIAGNVMGARAIAALSPAVASVMLQTQVLFAALAGWLMLGEAVSRRFVIGALIAIAGVVYMRVGDGAQRVGLTGTLWGLGAGACFGLMQVVSRKYVARIRPVVVNALRLWASVLFLLPGQWTAARFLGWRPLALMATAALAGPFLGRLCLLYATKYVPAATSTLLGLSAPLFTLALALVTLGEWPGYHEQLGGAVVVAGMLLALRR